MALEAAIAAMVGGTVMSAFAQRAQGKQQAKWMKYNAAVAEAKAKAEERAGLVAGGRKREEGRRFKARQLALYAKAGVDPTIGSPLVVMQDTAIEIERDARLIALTGVERAGFLESEAGLLRAQAGATRRAGRTAFGTTLLTGLGGAGLGYATYLKES